MEINPKLAEIQDKYGRTFVYHNIGERFERVWKAYRLIEENKPKITIKNLLNSRKSEFTKNK